MEDKQRTSQIISAVITLIVTLLGIYGYQIIVVQPQLEALAQLTAACTGG